MAENKGTKRAQVGVKKRIMIMFWIFIACMGVVILRLGHYQLIRGDELKRMAIEQQTRDQRVAAKRGSIYDRNMEILAQSASCENVVVNPREIQAAVKAQATRRAQAQLNDEAFNEEDIVNKLVTNLTEILGVEEEFVRKEISLDYASRTIKKNVDPSVANKIRALNLTGVYFEQSAKRYYPFSDFASHVIGFTNIDGNGQNGLEFTLESTLSGTAGRIQVIRDVNNNSTPYEYENYIAPEDGRGIVLTIDKTIQYYTENYLAEAYNTADIQNGAAAIVMDPKTGEILAMAVEPNFDLNDPRMIDEELMVELLGEPEEGEEAHSAIDYYNALWRNKAVCDTYEPGSTFKSIVAAIGIETGAINPDTISFNCVGYKQVGPHTIHCHKRVGHGEENFVQALENSCNPAFMEIGAAIGNSRFREYYEAFGFTQKTDFLLPGEEAGIFFTDSNFNEAELATSSFGQGFTITPLQMITAFSAVVNGGKLMKPQLVKAYTDSEGNVVGTVESELVREVISESTSRKMRAALESVVANGTGSGAFVEGYRIGGKTGTSEKQPRNEDKYVASFVGFAPADDPQLVCLLILDEPAGGQGGGAIAAPAVGKILADSLAYMGYKPQYSESDKEIETPSLIGMTTWDAEQACKELGLKVSIRGGGSIVTNQLPEAKTYLAEGDTVTLYTEAVEEVKVEMPDFTGMTRIEAYRKAEELNLKIVMTISGGGQESQITDTMVIISQNTPPKTLVNENSVVTVEFEREDEEE